MTGSVISSAIASHIPLYGFLVVRAAFPSWCYNEQHNVNSVLMPMLSGVLMPIISFSGVFLLTAGILLGSVPFARALQTKVPQPPPAAACGT